MSNLNRIILVSVFLCLYVSQSFAIKKDETISSSPQSPPAMFLENAGQFIDGNHNPIPQINFMLKANGVKVFIERGALHYQFVKADSLDGQAVNDEQKNKEKKQGKIHTYTLDAILLGANKNAEIVAEDKQDYHENYYLPQCPQGATAYAYRKITYKEIYPGIDWVLYTTNGKLEYDFIVHEGADPKKIKIQYNGAISLNLKEGALMAGTPLGTITEKAPYSYDTETKEKISSHFELNSNILTIKTAPHKGKMVIDPILMFSEYYGGFYDDQIYASTWNNLSDADKSFIIVAGTTNSFDWPIMTAVNVTNPIGTPQQHHAGVYGDGNYDGFIAAYTPGGAMSWATYFGGTGNDALLSIACDKNGNVFAGGGVNSNGLATFGRNTISGTASSFQSIFADAILLKLNWNGTLSWSQYFGGNGLDKISGLTCDAIGNVYATGTTNSSSNIATAGSYQTTNPYSVNKAFLAKFDNSTGSQTWSTYYSKIVYSDNDQAQGNCLISDKDGYIYIGGLLTLATTPPNTPWILNRSFISKFSGNGSFINERMFLDTIGIVLMSSPPTTIGTNIYALTYDTTTFIDSAGNINHGTIYAGGSNFVELNTNLDTLFRTNFSVNSIKSLAITNDNIVIAGGTASGHAFVSEYVSGALENLTSSGGSSIDIGYAVAANDNSRFYIAGQTYSKTGIGYYNPNFNNGNDLKLYIGESNTSSTMSTDAFFEGYYSDLPIMFAIGCGCPLPFPVCKGAGYIYPFFATNPAGGAVFSSAASYTMQLSDSSGSFQHNINIGHSKNYGSIAVRIPDTIPAGPNYRLRIIASNPFFISKELSIAIFPAPTLVLSTNSPVCQDDTLKASFTDTTKGNVTYAWYKQGASSFYPGLLLNFPNATPADNGKYILQSKLGLCVVTDTIQMIVKPKPTVASITNNTPICAEQPLQITIHDTNTALVVYSWTGPNGYTASAKDTTILNANTSMTGMYRLAYGLDGCYRYDSTSVVVNTKPGFDSISTNAPICDNDTLLLFANSTLGNAAAYTWRGPSGFSSTEQNPFFKADLNATGYYNVFSKLGNCISDTDSIQVIVKPLPLKPRLSSNSPVKPGGNIMLNMDSVTDATYSWAGPDSFSSKEQNPVVSYVTTDASGIYTGTVTVNGCSTSNMIKVEIDAHDANAYFTLLFPNPNKGTFTVKGILQKPGDIPLQVRDAAGQIVYSTTLQSDKKRLEREVTLPGSLANGSYFVRLLINGEQKSIPFTLGK